MSTPRFLTRLKHFQATASTKIKGTILERWMTYWKSVGNDYKQVAISVGDDIKSKPLKSCIVFTGMGLLALSAKQNPDVKSFRTKFVQSCNELALVNESLVSPYSKDHLEFINSCYKQDILRYKSFLFFSIMWVDTRSKHCDNYWSRCPHLQWRYLNFGRQIVDVGFLNIWWIISRKMLDYDVNYL